jgi:hypothetical protein
MKKKSTLIWTEDQLIRKDNCFECGLDGEIHYHHVVPAVIGGTKTIPLCVMCHGKVHGKKFVNHKELQRIGIEKAKKEGKFTGRVKGSTETIEQFLNKPKSLEIIKLAKKGLKYKEISEIIKCSQTTVTKVLKIYEEFHKVIIPRSKKGKHNVYIDLTIPHWFIDDKIE